MPSSTPSPNNQPPLASGPPATGRRTSGVARLLANHRAILLVAFAFTVTADPVSSVAYAVEAALRALGGNLSLLLPTMAVATGVEAPSSAIAQLGQLDDNGRRRFGRITLWLTLLIVGGLTMGITALAVRLGIGIPPVNSTQIGDVARVAGNPALFALFQAASAVILLAAASSSFQAGPGLLKALARADRLDGSKIGVLPGWMGRTNRHHTPYWAALVFLLVSATVIAAAGARDQELVLFYAVAVFVSFLSGLVAMLKFSHAEHRRWWVLLNGAGTVLVGFTLVVNLLHGYPVVSLAAALLIAGTFYWLWVRAGRPRGVSQIEQIVEAEVGEDT